MGSHPHGHRHLRVANHPSPRNAWATIQDPIGALHLRVRLEVLLQFEQQEILTVGLIIQGIARSSLMTVLVLTLVELPGIGERYAGLASGLFFTAAEFGGVMGPTLLGITYDYSGDFTLGLGLLSVTALLLTCATLVLMRRVKQTEATSGSPS